MKQVSRQYAPEIHLMTHKLWRVFMYHTMNSGVKSAIALAKRAARFESRLYESKLVRMTGYRQFAAQVTQRYGDRMGLRSHNRS